MAVSEKKKIEDSDISEQIENHIRSAIASTDDGGRLPSVRQLMQEFNASKFIVDKAVSRLQGEGLIEARSRSGLYRVNGMSVKDSLIEYLFFGCPDSMHNHGFHNELFSCLNAVLSQNSRFARLNMMRQETDTAAVVRRLVQTSSNPVITCNLGIRNIFDLSGLVQAGIPVLHLLPNFADPIEESLILDDEAIVRMQVEHLVSLGHKRIAYLHAVDDRDYYRAVNARRDAFSRLAIEFGLSLEPGWMCNTGWEQDKVSRDVCRLLSDDVKPTAFVINDHVVNGVYAGIRKCGLVPGKDISVVGCDDMPWATHVDPPLTTIGVSRMKIAEKVCELLSRIVLGEKIGRNVISPELILRKSTSEKSNCSLV